MKCIAGEKIGKEKILFYCFSEELNLMGVLNYLQSMVNDGTIAKDGNKYFIPQGSSGSGGGGGFSSGGGGGRRWRWPEAVVKE